MEVFREGCCELLKGLVLSRREARNRLPCGIQKLLLLGELICEVFEN